MLQFFSKMLVSDRSPARVSRHEIVLSWLGSFVAIGCIGLMDQYVARGAGLPLLIGSFGASAVLVFGACGSPFAQPRNLVGGHVISAITGVFCSSLLPDMTWLAASLAVATSIALMHMTVTLHPPGAATALVAVTGGESIHQLGYFFAIVPCLAGALVMLLVALLANNLPKSRRYPAFWW